MADSLAGVWRLESSDDFEALMASFGVGLIMRKLAIKTVPTLTILIKNDSEWEICTEVWSNTWTTKFEIGKEFDEKLPNGKKVRFVCSVVDQCLVQRQIDSKYPTNITRLGSLRVHYNSKIRGDKTRVTTPYLHRYGSNPCRTSILRASLQRQYLRNRDLIVEHL
ncbi:fatty acid-binding protein homolog 6-like isoform X1 [Varroa destructor]|uniref:Lipocalin/cytosolic fatty-acid binding domain-containing protein n=1 Tax=Varroa destructor TaxID=109461 RepID=A0A7M7KZH3_VARDE|nr:fatty acid-binding protein homolog 6-like isoform X1 [Varroa destructor]XP_022671789.1 fatty acid-binding protein homolog 6-like isoform X1 [Varroa destructor]XP_022671790.1 fatty acid-binding protein homolog 6-like isoform X1 [Varroa destructor]